jgi:predicted ATPase
VLRAGTRLGRAASRGGEGPCKRGKPRTRGTLQRSRSAGTIRLLAVRSDGGQPFYLVETLKGLLEREVLLPSLQENRSWGLVLRSERLTQTAAGEVIPSSVRELIGSHLGRLSAPAWAILVAAAVMGTGLTFERLCQVAQVDELAGLQALEELVRSGLLCEGKWVEEAQAFDGYSFPGEMMREVVYQEAGAIRQRVLQRRVSLAMQEEAENDLSADSGLPHPTPIAGQALAKIRKEQGRRVVAGAANRGMEAITGPQHQMLYT